MKFKRKGNLMKSKKTTKNRKKVSSSMPLVTTSQKVSGDPSPAISPLFYSTFSEVEKIFHEVLNGKARAIKIVHHSSALLRSFKVSASLCDGKSYAKSGGPFVRIDLKPLTK
jgi:hypothetical protein